MFTTEPARDLAILIVTYNSESVIETCLKSIPPHWLPSVVVVDNASTDRTAQIVNTFDVRYMQRETNDGFGAAANAGAETASARFLLFLNPDCILPLDFFALAVQTIKTRTEDCYVPKSLDEGETVISGCQPGYTRWKLIDDMLQTNYGRGFLSNRIRNLRGYHNPSWNWPHGACLIVSRERFFAVGGFDPRFFLYMEDVDLGKRLQKAGCRIVTLDCSVTHLRSSGARISRSHHLSLLNSGRIRYAEIHYGPFLAPFLKLLGLPAQIYCACTQPKDATA